MSAKITIRELDGTEYQLKKRIAQQVHAAGYSRKVARGLHEMIAVSLSYAMRIVVLAQSDCDGGAILPPRQPEGLLLFYPHKSQTTQRYASISA